MAGASLATVFIVFISFLRSSNGQTNAVNVAVNKPITALITCGTPPESFYAQSEGSKPVTQRQESLCDSSNATFAHPPELMVDLNDPTTGDVFTWWQSTSKNMLHQAGMNNNPLPEATITLNLLESYLVDYISIQMGDSVRPTRMTLLSSLNGITFRTWEHKVTTISDCIDQFGVPQKTIADSENAVLCSSYGRTEQAQYEIIQFTMPVAEEFTEWKRARYIRFDFFAMNLKFGLLSGDIFHHYTVRNIVVEAQCECNGHANDCALQFDEESENDRYQCVCGGNTGGFSCDQCLPFFNQLPYQQGFTNFACLECNCFWHSEECYYDPVVGAVNGSLSGEGIYHGGGVCLDCRNNTAGINCQSCTEFYYRPITSLQIQEDACQPCDCFLDGTREDPGVGLIKGHCVTNNDTLLPIGLLPGDCYCKENVIGSKCDECQDSYFHLTDNNPEGCQSCNCFTAGTFNSTTVCEKDASGQCPCKTFVTGRRCETCQDEFYGLSAGELDGCLPCECNSGGSVSNLCDKGSGQCICKNYVSGRQCDRPLLMSYYPTVHFINAEFETVTSPYWERDEVSLPGFSYFGYIAITGALTVSTTITIPARASSGTLIEIVLRYASQTFTSVGVSIAPDELTSGAVQMGQASMATCLGQWCYARVFNLDTSRGSYFEVQPGGWTVSVFVNIQVEAVLYLDQVVFIPEEFLNPVGVLDAVTASQFTTTCDVQTNDMRLGTETEEFCLDSVFIITSTYLSGNIPCNCDLSGSVSNNCEPYGGQCPCQPGVGGRQCDVCLPEFYDFRSTGCKACACYSDDKVCDSLTGQCECPTNTVGRQCDRCITYAWGLNSTTGCKMCNCNPEGSVSLQCNSLDGSCFCHPGIGQEKCTECIDGFHTLSDDGCTSCRCDLAGSYNSTCNVTTGQCICKENTQGLLCETCSASSFHKAEMYATGCLDCVCMGITSECTSSFWKNALFEIPTEKADLWQVTSSNNAQELYREQPIATLQKGDNYLSVDITDASDVYWQPIGGTLSENLLYLYGNEVRFVLYYEASSSLASPIAEPKVILSGLANTYTYTLNPVLNATFTPVTIQMQETYWRTAIDNFEISRQEFIKTLSKVDYFLIPATLFFDQHISSIGAVYYEEATPPGSEFYDPRAATALAIENCNCGTGYVGLSCEECAPEFYRTNVTDHAYFGECIPCTCYGHSDSCDPNTGQCMDCQHNTTGINCEICANGTYGNALAGTADDCMDCPCGEPKAFDSRCEEIEGVVTCLSCLPGHVGPLCDSCDLFYFGEPELEEGFCEECNCSGNALECDIRSGQCIECQFRSTGFNCERCENTTYGDSSMQNCDDCNCHVLGSLNPICNHRSGQCPCKYGVGTFTCSQCLENFYGFGLIDGCIDCDCHELGSTSLQCNEQGLCTCFGGAVGDKCDVCSMGYFGLPEQSCESCVCDSVGTVGGSAAICDIIDGQCPCQPGVGNRVCDRCLPTWINFGPTGCDKCDQCVDTLYASLLNLDEVWLELWSVAILLGELQDLDRELQPLSVVVNDTAYTLSQTIQAYDELKLDVESIDEDAYRAEVNQLNLEAENNLAAALAVEGILTVKLEEVQVLMEESEQLYKDSLSTDQLLDNYIAMMELWNDTSYEYYADALLQADVISSVSFIEDQVLVAMELELSQNTSVLAANFFGRSTAQGQRVNTLQSSIRSTDATLRGIQATVDETHGILDGVDVTLGQVDNILNSTEYQIRYSDSIVESIIMTLSLVDGSLNSAVTSLSAGDSDLVAISLIKDGAPTGFTGIPIDQSINQYSINGWTSAMVATEFALGDLQDRQTTTEQFVLLAENTAFTLATTAQDTVTVFSAAQASGQEAVDVIDYYEAVVVTINQAQMVIQNANDTIDATNAFLAEVSIESLAAQANSSKFLSRSTLDVVELRETDVEALNNSLTQAENAVEDSEALWAIIEADTATLQTSATSLALLAADPMIQPAINAGITDAVEASTTSNTVMDNSAVLDQAVLANEQEIVVVQESIANSTMLLNEIPIVVGQIETDVDDLYFTVNQLELLRNETAEQRVVVTDKLALLQQKLLLAQEAVADSKQPVRFAPDSSLSIARVPTAQMLFNELRMDLKTDLRDSLAFFLENRETGALFAIEVVTSHVLFKFNVNQDMVTIESPIDVCCGEWYHIIATRYGNEGMLTVERLSTGGASTDFRASVITYDKYINFHTTPLYYVGGIPAEYQLTQTLTFTGTIQDIMANETDKVQSRDFEGCLANIWFDGEELDLWRPESLAGSTSCCPRPDVPDLGAVTLIDGISFTGFGYFQLLNTQEEFNVFQQARMSIEFRTSISDGVVFLVTRQDLISYIGIFMEANKIVFEMNTAGNTKYKLTSNRDYNNAEWVQVIAAYNASYYSMQIRAANVTQTLLFYQESRTYAPLSFPNLRYSSSKIMIGSPDPALSSSTVRGPTNLRFAGCMRNLQLSDAGSLVLVPRPMNNETVADSEDVSLDGCLEQVVPGIGFGGDFAYAQLNFPAELARVQRIQLQFKSREANAILAYSWDAESFNKLIYIALYHGNIFVQYNIGEGLSDPLQTTGLRLNTGQWQTVMVEFTGLSATLRINDMPIILSNRQLSTDGILITGSNSYLYVGGLPSTIPTLFGGEFPVRESLDGDIKDFVINELIPNFNDDQVLIEQDGVTLSGVSPPVTELPPLPYVTEAPPTSITLMPTCSALPDVFYDPSTLRFGLLSNSYATFPLSEDARQHFLSRFLITIYFRAVSPNGILFYAADSALTPQQWIALVMQDGYVEFNMISDTRSVNGLGIRTKQKYDTGEWIEVSVLRINEFVAILVTETRDYTNNDQPSNGVNSRINIATNFHLGGISSAILPSTFPLTFTTGFDGCISHIIVDSDEVPNAVILDFENPSLFFANGVAPCSRNDIMPGAFFNGTGYLQLENNFRVGNSLSLNMTIRTTVRESILFAVSSGLANFVALDIFEGRVRAVISHGNQSPYIVRSTAFTSDYEICDNLPHTIFLSFTQLGLQLYIDKYPPDVTYFTAGVPTINTNSPIYFAGIPDTGSVSLVSGIITNTFTGCIQSILLNNVQRNPRENVNSVGMETGCPFPLT
ncbi:laminin subunit alpha-1-like isoform X2 [Antedon mediterranea]|uniref:laminin subunit alpha-1-like isoform X2 n=1 Tax=Antedon mediterranea TaxID=105859 RepID=UPI003AF53C3B